MPLTFIMVIYEHQFFKNALKAHPYSNDSQLQCIVKQPLRLKGFLGPKLLGQDENSKF